jgi:hypothetical protein
MIAGASTWRSRQTTKSLLGLSHRYGAARLQVRKRCIVCTGLVRRLDHDLHSLLDLTHHFDRPNSREGLDFLFLFCSSAASLLEVTMTVEKQREVIRLWNQLRKLEGPAAEELRIQILECFSEREISEKGLAGKSTVKRAA